MVDLSCSMGWDQVYTCKQLADTYYSATKNEKQIEVNVYGFTASNELKITKITDSKFTQDLLSAERHGTPSTQAIDWYDDLIDKSKDKHLFIFLTDGSPNRSPLTHDSYNYTESEKIMDTIKQTCEYQTHEHDEYMKAVMQKLRKNNHAVFGVLIGRHKQFIETVFDSDSAVCMDIETARTHISKRFAETVKDFITKQ